MNLVDKYDEIMTEYRKGSYGLNLNMHEILEKANEPDLFENMSLSDVDILINRSSGFTKQMFCELRDKKLNCK